MIFFIFGILALLAAFCLFRSEYKAAAVIPGALAAVLIVISCVSFVPTGYTGIVTTFGKVENGTKDAGVVVKAPWQSIVKMDNRVQEVSIDLSASEAHDSALYSSRGKPLPARPARYEQ